MIPPVARRYLIPALIAALLLVLGIGWLVNTFRPAGTNGSAGNSVTVRRGTLAAFVTATGKLTAERRARLAFPVGGTVLMVMEVGTEVGASEPVALLENPELELRREEALAGVDAARAQLEQARAGAPQGDIDATQAQLQAAQLALSVAQARLDAVAPENRATSTEIVDVENARAAVRAAEAALSTALDGAGDEALAAFEAQLRQAEIRLELAESALASATLAAPFAGVVTERAVSEGERVAGGQLIASISDPDTLYLAADVDEVDVGRVVAGQRVTVTVDAFPTQPFGGTVTVVAPAATPQRGTTTYLAKIALEPAGPALRLDMSAEAQIRTADESEVLLLPQSAIRYAENQPYVLVRRGGAEQQQPVTLGAADDRDVVVLEGLNEGDVVVLP